jgi:hypothetical protein
LSPQLLLALPGLLSLPQLLLALPGLPELAWLLAPPGLPEPEPLLGLPGLVLLLEPHQMSSRMRQQTWRQR